MPPEPTPSAPGPVQVSVLGPLQARTAAGSAALGGPRQRSVLAMLALAAPAMVTVDRLVDGIWGESPPDNPKATLQVFVSHLRRSLAAVAPEVTGPLIVHRDPGYVLHPAVEVDLTTYQALRAHARQALADGDARSAAGLLEEALACWRGEALIDLRDLPFAAAATVRLDEELTLAREDLVDLRLALGDVETLLPGLEEQVRLHPTRERGWGQLMTALYRADRQADALAAFGRARERLADELGLDPGEALRQLELAILRQDTALAAPVASPSAAPTPAPRARDRIVPPLTPTLGRGEQVDELSVLLARPEARLVTLTGVGGAGKTRLATAVALHADQDGVWSGGCVFVPMADVVEADDALRAVFHHLLPHETTPEDVGEAIARISESVGEQRTLTVLDNLEGVPGAPAVVRRLLEAAPGLTVLATSRVALGMSGELEQPVAPLSPEASEELFRRRATAADPSFRPDDVDAAAIRRLCSGLDGLPLAIEIAAARVALVPPAQMADRVRDGLDLLATTATEVPDRHRTMTAILRWSLDQLSPAGLDLARLLARVEGTFTLEAAEALGRDLAGRASVLDRLTELTAMSLVRRVGSRVEVRFGLLRLASTVLRDDDVSGVEEVLDHFADWLITRGAGWPAELTTSGAELALARFDDERLQLEAALARSRGARAADLVDLLVDYWVASGQAGRGIGMVAAVIEGGRVVGRDLARCCCAYGKLAYQSTDWSAAEERLLEARDLLDREPPSSRAHDRLPQLVDCYLGGCLVVTGRAADGVLLAQQALAGARAGDDYEVQAVSLSILAIAAAVGGDFDSEAGYYRERLEVVRRRGDAARTADTLNTLAEIALDDGDAEAARDWCTQSLEIAADRFAVERRDATISLARTQVLEGDDRAAAETVTRALRLSLETAQSLGIAQCWRVAACLTGADDARDGVTLFAAAQRLRPSPSGTDDPIERDLAGHLARLRTQLGAPAFERTWLRGGLLPVAAATELAEAVVARRGGEAEGRP